MSFLHMSEKEKEVIKHIVTVDNMTVKVAKKGISNTKFIESGILLPDDADMDKRARQAISSAKNKAKVCNKPLAVYDKKTQTAYLVDSNGKQVKVG